MTSHRGARPDAPQKGSSAQAQNCGPRPAQRRFPWLELLVLLSSGLLLVNGGRLSGSDAEAQTVAAHTLVTQGTLSRLEPCRTSELTVVQWCRAPNGRYYQAHDLGSVLLAVPAAFVGARLSRAAETGDGCRPPAPTRVLVALTYCAVSVVLAVTIALLYRTALSDRAVVAASLLSAFGTWVLVYSKLPNDVVAGAAAVAAAMYLTSRLAIPDATPGPRWAAATGLSLALVGWLRYTFLPFALLAVALSCWNARRRLRAATCVVGLGVFLLTMAPQLAYNAIRTGSSVLPALALPQHSNTLTEPAIVGLYGMWLAPNNGLLVFSPLLALAAIAGPVVVRTGHARLRVPALWFGVASLVYVLVISRLTGWGGGARGTFGPRHLVVITPVLCAWLGLLVARARPEHRRAWCLVAATAVLWSLLPAVPHLQLARAMSPAAMNVSTPWPATHVAILKAIGLGLAGRELPAPPEVANDPVRRLGRGFPDFWWVHMIRYGGRMRVAGLLIGIVLCSAAAWSALRLVAWGRSLPPDPVPRGS